MRYQGGKARLALRIAKHIDDRRGNRRSYVEPFLGGASVFSMVAPGFDTALGCDAQEDLIMMWQAAQGGWRAPEYMSRSEYESLRRSPEPSPMRAFAAYPCSFAGKRFGGYAVSLTTDRNYASEGSRGIEKKARSMRRRGVRLWPADYRVPQIDARVTADTVVYCDPPYRGTLSYKGTDTFDHDEFWGIMRTWSARGALVLVSEYSAPDDWVSIMTIERHTSTALDNRGARATDQLYIHKESA